jgi:hypothetical protein
MVGDPCNLPHIETWLHFSTKLFTDFMSHHNAIRYTTNSKDKTPK